MRIRAFVAALLMALALFAPVALAGEQEDARVEKAKEMFDRYTALGRAFDAAIADMYADDALIRNRRTYPSGEVREIILPAPKYKDLIRATMPVAQERGDTNTYSDVTFSLEGEGVRITADRYSEMKTYHSPLSILVRPSGSGAWFIYEELSESQP